MTGRPRRLSPRVRRRGVEADDPLSAVANLVDVFLVFIVALLMSFLTAYHLEELLSRDSEITVLKRTPEGEMTVITKRGTEIRADKVSRSEAEGRGTRLGVAYQLEDGTMIYLPDEEPGR